MDETIPVGSIRKEEGWRVPPAIAESTLGTNLTNAIIAKQRFIENGMPTEAEMFEKTIQGYRSQLSQIGLDPDKVIKERVRLLTEALQEKT